MITGQGTVFPPGKVDCLDEIRDGTMNTVFLVNWPDADLPWNAPVDLPLADIGRWLEPADDPQAKELAPGRKKTRGFYAADVAGLIDYLDRATSLAQLASLVLIDDTANAAKPKPKPHADE